MNTSVQPSIDPKIRQVRKPRGTDLPKREEQLHAAVRLALDPQIHRCRGSGSQNLCQTDNSAPTTSAGHPFADPRVRHAEAPQVPAERICKNLELTGDDPDLLRNDTIFDQRPSSFGHPTHLAFDIATLCEVEVGNRTANRIDLAIEVIESSLHPPQKYDTGFRFPRSVRPVWPVDQQARWTCHDQRLKKICYQARDVGESVDEYGRCRQNGLAKLLQCTASGLKGVG